MITGGLRIQPMAPGACQRRRGCSLVLELATIGRPDPCIERTCRSGSKVRSADPAEWRSPGVMRLERAREIERQQMLNHVMVGSNDIERSKRFYDAVLGTLGAGEPIRNMASTGHTRLFYRHDGSTFCVSEPINGEAATFANGGTIAFRCSSAEQVRIFHDTAVAHGGTSIEDEPGLRESNLGAMHLAYVRDPDGNKLCAIHRVRPAG